MKRTWRSGKTDSDGSGVPEMDSTAVGAEYYTSTMTLNLVSNSYLEESTAKIRVKQVPWEVRLLSLPSFTSSHQSKRQLGISTRRTYHPRGARAHQESRQAA